MRKNTNMRAGETTEEKVALYETTRSLLDAMYAEVQELAKKKPDGTLNGAKVKMINRLLKDVSAVLASEPHLKYLDLLDDSDLPQYSDVVLILSQYVGAMDDFFGKYHRYVSGQGDRWITDKNPR